MLSESRRNFLKASSAVLAVSTGALPIHVRQARGQQITIVPERGAKLHVLRWKRFVQGDEDTWAANTRKFSDRTGIEVTMDSENWEDLRPKAAVAANTGAGPDIIINFGDDAHLYPDKVIDLTDVAEYLGKKYGGWYELFRTYGMHKGKWIGIPMGGGSSALTYRESQIKAAGFSSIPRDLPGFLKLCQALKAKGTPPGFTLGHATGDANIWCHWLIWSHGATLVDKNDRVAINSPETVRALEYARQLYATFIPGTLSWLDPSNNKAFLSGDVSITSNGVSIYYVAKNSSDPKIQTLADDINHANMPVGPAGRPTEFGVAFTAFVPTYCKFPNAEKKYLRFMWEADQFAPWIEASLGYVGPPLRAYSDTPVWKNHPKLAAFRDVLNYCLPAAYPGSLGPASSACMADFVVVDMVAEACTGGSIPDAIRRAEARAKRYYR